MGDEAMYREREVVPLTFTATAWRPSPWAGIPTGEKGFWAEFASSDMSVQTKKTGHFVLPLSAGLTYMRITGFKASRPRSTLSFSLPISAAFIALNRRVSVYLDRQSIVTEKVKGVMCLKLKDFKIAGFEVGRTHKPLPQACNSIVTGKETFANQPPQDYG
ncbi:hypothetical protein EVAR_96014_1 [Eumeta japonica]|uniref:Uncharacterized protein n=1 Tax=Eumeta variegata TaxID=151549 RepID=A0A4C1XFA1_EUMVA|nr:hypothetical protein EVAR_96014_1 [Eumeta japonica]